MVALGVGFKCPHKIHLNTQWAGGGADFDRSTFSYLKQSGEDFIHHITIGPSGFSDLPTALQYYKLASSRIARHSMLLAYFPHGEPRNYTLGSCVLYFTKNMSSGSKMA